MNFGGVPSARQRALCFDARESLDHELARAARKSGPLRLAIGVGLEKLAVTGGHSALGFATLRAYASERCGWSARWVQQARLLARKAEEWPALGNALISGRTSWSMALEVVKVATAESIGEWLQISGKCTVHLADNVPR